MTGAALLEATDLACRRGERLIFAGLSFALAPGAALLLVGPNGSGKSSLLRVLAGLLPPEAGELRWGGEKVASDPAAYRARLHFIGHQDAVKPVLTVGETLRFWAALRGVPAAPDALARFRLEEVADWPCRFLSSGQRRRLALSRLVASPAPLWLLDEPATGLDDVSVGDLESAVAEHRRGGGIAVLSTHAPIALPAAETINVATFAPKAAPAFA